MIGYFYSQIDPIVSSRTLVWVAQVTMIILIIVGTVVFFYSVLMSTISDIELTVTENVIINSSSHNVCTVITSDERYPSKTIQRCNFEIGKKITVNYKEGFPNAKIVEP